MLLLDWSRSGCEMFRISPQNFFDDTEVLCNTHHYLARLHCEAIEIHKHKNCFNKKEESLRVKKSWYPALSTCKTKPSRIKIQNASQPATLQMRSNQQHAQQQGQGDSPLYNSQSPRTDCPRNKARSEKTAPATPERTTAVAQRLGGRRRTLRTTSTDLESCPLPQLLQRSCRNEERPPVAVTQRRGGRRKKTASTALESGFLPLLQC